MICNKKNDHGLKAAFKDELIRILDFWMTYTPDQANGGFFGELDSNNKPVNNALKGVVLHARILWTFSAACRLISEKAYLYTASRAYQHIRSCFFDAEYGGVYWSITAEGEPADTKKQVYGIAFTIYGLAEYYRVTQNKEALQLAIELYQDIEAHSYDDNYGGYLEAFTRDWQAIDDLRLSDKDANEKKTMNTHLHILEAYTNLYSILPDRGLGIKLECLINLFQQHIVDNKTGHLNLFMNEQWQVRSDTISYGHDIEASWLLVEAAKTLGDELLINEIKKTALNIAKAAEQGLTADGCMIYEYEPAINRRIAECHWWVQAEAVVGFYNAWQLSGEQRYLNKTLKVWAYINAHIADHKNGEWHWGRHQTGELIEGYGKAGFWKCPYHNGRACMEMLQRL